MAIDLGDDGITYNQSSPQPGPNNFQSFPIIATASSGKIEGWLGGSAPDATFRVDVFASAGYSLKGAGQAQSYLGSLEVTTDDDGSVVFDVPFAPPIGLPVLTATATDQFGDTSEVSGLRPGVLEVSQPVVRKSAGQPLVLLSAASGDGITLNDPEAGPLDLTWMLNLSVPSGTLELSTTTGLTGSGDGTSTLTYQGLLSAVNAALDGMQYTPAPGFHGDAVIDIEAHSAGALPARVQVLFSDGLFLVTTTADSGPGSLRQAILDSNLATGGTNAIDFSLPGSGIRTIVPLAPLPAITNPVVVDGFTQQGYSGTPLIQITGAQAGTGDGLLITSSGSTIRGLEITSFLRGAGIHISGASATLNTIAANDLGTDPTGAQTLANDFGVQVSGGASDNLIGGPSAASGNLIAFNFGPGVSVLDDSTLGNQISSNRVFSNDDNTGVQFDGDSHITLPNNLISGFGQAETIEAMFQTTSGGVILGYQSVAYDQDYEVVPEDYQSSLYVGTDGRLFGGLAGFPLIASNVDVADGLPHQVALVADDSSGTESLYLDGQLIGSASGSLRVIDGGFNQIGVGYTADHFPDANNDWYSFVGEINNLRIWSAARSAAQVRQDMVTAPLDTESDLAADFRFDDGTGLKAHDQTANHNDGDLMGVLGHVPVWVSSPGVAIDLAGDGVTYNGASPRQGPNNLQNFPILATTASGGFVGWLSGSLAETTFRIDLFANANYSAQGARRPRTTSGRWMRRPTARARSSSTSHSPRRRIFRLSPPLPPIQAATPRKFRPGGEPSWRRRNRMSALPRTFPSSSRRQG